jgi:hypothetical protein
MTDISLIRGDTSSITFELTEGGTPSDLTGSTVFFTAKPALTNDITDTTAVIAIEVTNHSDPTNGITIIPLTSSDTDVNPGLYYYDIQVKRQDNSIVSIPNRQLEVFADVTRRTS